MTEVLGMYSLLLGCCPVHDPLKLFLVVLVTFSVLCFSLSLCLSQFCSLSFSVSHFLSRAFSVASSHSLHLTLLPLLSFALCSLSLSLALALHFVALILSVLIRRQKLRLHLSL